MPYGRRRLLDDPPERLRVRRPSVTDADRLLYSDYFRRLGGVTQVVPPDHTVVYHDRLTHSLKVAQVTRGMAYFLKTRLHEDVDVDAARAGALAHDLGHAPFGHHGEEVLQSIAEERGLVDSFEGNAQTLRILARNAIRHRRAGRPPVGLNWSWRSLAATVKYPWLRHADGQTNSKYGAYDTEADLLQEIRANGPKPGARTGQCLEVQLVDWADDISYGVHDVEDFFLAGLIPLHDRDAWNRFGDIDKIVSRVQNSYERAGHPADEFEAVYQRAMQKLPAFFPEAPPSRTARTTVELQNFTSLLITFFTDGVAVDNQGDLTITSDQRVQVELLKSLTQHYVWGLSQTVGDLQARQEDLLRRVVDRLMDLTHATFNGWEPPAAASDWMPHEVGVTQLPWPRLEYAVVEALFEGDRVRRGRTQSRLRGVFDFLCSQTDAQVVQIGIDEGIIPVEERDRYLYIGLAPDAD